MARRYFDTLLESSRGRGRRRGLTLPVSIALHLVALVAVVVVPLMVKEPLPEVADTTVLAFFAEPATAPPPPPPPPPPPAPAAPRPKMQEPPRQKPVPVPEEPRFVAPVETPPEVPADTPDLGQGEGVPGGSPEGVPGGVPEGVPGGQEGGVPGGVVGGSEGGVVGGVIGGVGGAEPPPVPDGPVRVGGQVKAPRKVKDAAPVYPEVAKQARVQGTVILEATIGSDGRVQEVRVLKGVPLLNEAALDAVRSWAYTPTLLNGVPVPVVMSVTVTFRIGA